MLCIVHWDLETILFADSSLSCKSYKKGLRWVDILKQIFSFAFSTHWVIFKVKNHNLRRLLIWLLHSLQCGDSFEAQDTIITEKVGMRPHHGVWYSRRVWPIMMNIEVKGSMQKEQYRLYILFLSAYIVCDYSINQYI